MICWHCHQEVKEVVEYCPHCGRKILCHIGGEKSENDEETGYEQTEMIVTPPQEKTDDLEITNRFNNGQEQKKYLHKIVFLITPIAVIVIVAVFFFSGTVKQQNRKSIFHTHQWIDATCTQPKTCSLCNATDGKPLGHQWEDATCTKPRTCSRCKATEGEALGHQWEDATCIKPRTCSRCKTTEGVALGHQWKDATCTQPRTCNRCETTDGEALGHKWIPATYDQPKTCSRCKGRQGSVKGYVPAEELEAGAWSDKVTTYNSYDTHAYEFENELIKCRKIKMGIEIEVIKGEPFGEYMVLTRSDGQWKKIGTINVEKENVIYDSTLVIDPAVNIDSIISVPTEVAGQETEWKIGFYFYEAQVE